MNTMEYLDFEPCQEEWDESYEMEVDEEDQQYEDARSEFNCVVNLKPLISIKRLNSLSYGVVGLGALGSQLARILADSKFQVIVWNRTLNKTIRAKLSSHKRITFVSSVKALVLRSNIVFSCLRDDNAIKKVFGPLFLRFKDKFYLECATVHPKFSKDNERIVRDVKGYYLEVQFMVDHQDPSTNLRKCLVFTAGKSKAANYIKPIFNHISLNPSCFTYLGVAPLATMSCSFLSAKLLLDYYGVVSSLIAYNITDENDLEILKSCCRKSLFVSDNASEIISTIQNGLKNDPPTLLDETTHGVLLRRLRIAVEISSTCRAPTSVFTALLGYGTDFIKRSTEYFANSFTVKK